MNLLLTPLVARRAQQDKPFCGWCAEPPLPPSRQRRWFREAEEPAVEKCSPPRQLSRGSGRHVLLTVAIDCDPRARPRIQGTPRFCSEVALVAWRRVESSLVEEAPAGLSRNQEPYRHLGPIRRRAFTIARERSGVIPIRLTRTPSVAGSWERPGGEPGAPGERRSRRARSGCPDRVKP